MSNENKVIFTKLTDKDGKPPSEKSLKNMKEGKCIFPFIYDGETYNKCYKGKKGDWCATEVNKKGKMKKYAYCIYDKKTKKNSKPSKNKSLKKNKKTIEKQSKFYETQIYEDLDLKKGSVDLVIGNVQSGKTNVILGYAYKTVKVNKKIVIVVRNSKADAAQIKNRIGIKDDLQGIWTGFNEQIPEEQFKLKPLDNKNKQFEKFKTNEGRKEILEKYNTFIVLGNLSQLKKIFDFIKESSEHQFNICMDEFDLYAGIDNKTEKQMLRLSKLDNVYNKVGFTATPMALFLGINKIRENLNINRIFKLEPPTDYVGINNPRIKHHPVESVKRGKKITGIDDPMIEEQKKEQKIINKILGNCLEERKFCISLIISANENDIQEDLLDITMENKDNFNFFNKNWVGLTYNQNSVTIKCNIPGKDLNDEVTDDSIVTDKTGNYIGLKIGRVKKTSQKEQIIVKTPSGIIYKDKEDIEYRLLGALPSALQYLKKMGISRILIVAGKKAERGISFVDEDFESEIPYHLTDLYIRSETKETKKEGTKIKSATHCEALIQKMRILGRYKDSEDIHFWSTEELWEQIKKCYEQIVFYQDRLADLTKTETKLDTFEDWRDKLKQIEQTLEDFPDIKVAKKKIVDNQFKTTSSKEKNNISKEYEKDKEKSNKEPIIVYDMLTKGWTLTDNRYKKKLNFEERKEFLDYEQENSECKYSNCKNVESQIEKIIKELKTLSRYSDIDKKDKHQLTYYIPNIYVEPEEKTGIKTRAEQHGKDFDKHVKKIAKDKKQELLSDPKFIEYVRQKSDIFKNQDMKTLLSDDFMKRKTVYHVPNLQEKIYSYRESKELIKDSVFSGEEWTKIQKKEKLPLYYRYGTYKMYDTKKVPVLVEINFPNDFIVDGKTTKTSIKEGDVIWWQNMFGKVFVDIKEKNSDMYKETQKIKIELKSRDKKRPKNENENKERTYKGTKFEGFANPNPIIKDLFNEKILPRAIRLLLEKNKDQKLDFVLCDNKLNTVKTVLDTLNSDEKSRLDITIIEIGDDEYNEQVDLLKKDPEKYKDVKIVKGDLQEKLREIKNDNKLIYADACGSEKNLSIPPPQKPSWPAYNKLIINNNLKSDIIIGTFSVHDRHPISHFGRDIEQFKTITYEYGIKTIMKTYISIKNDFFNEWKKEFLKENPGKDSEREDVLEYKIESYKEIEELNESQRLIPQTS